MVFKRGSGAKLAERSDLVYFRFLYNNAFSPIEFTNVNFVSISFMASSGVSANLHVHSSRAALSIDNYSKALVIFCRSSVFVTFTFPVSTFLSSK